MGVDAQMFVKTKQKLSANDVRALSVHAFAAFGSSILSVTRPGEFSFWPEGRHALELIEAYGQDGPDITPKVGEQFIAVNLAGRYYGPGYERGPLHDYIAVASWLEHHIPDAKVFYGGDSSGICAESFGETDRRAFLLHFNEHGHAPYRHDWSDGKGRPPLCDFCSQDYTQNGQGPEGWAAFYCHGCGHELERERSTGKYVERKKR